MECGGAHTSAFIQKYDEDDALTALQLDFKLAVALQVSLSPQASSSREVSSRELRVSPFRVYSMENYLEQRQFEKISLHRRLHKPQEQTLSGGNPSRINMHDNVFQLIESETPLRWYSPGRTAISANADNIFEDWINWYPEAEASKKQQDSESSMFFPPKWEVGQQFETSYVRTELFEPPVEQRENSESKLEKDAESVHREFDPGENQMALRYEFRPMDGFSNTMKQPLEP